MKKVSKLEAEKEFQKLLDNIKKEYDKWLAQCKGQYEFYLNEKNKEIESFITQLKQYREKKKYEIERDLERRFRSSPRRWWICTTS